MQTIHVKPQTIHSVEQTANVVTRRKILIAAFVVIRYTNINMAEKERLAPCKISLNKIEKNIRQRSTKIIMIEKTAFKVKVLQCKKTIP